MREQLGLVLSALRTANPEQIESDEDFQSFEARVNGILSQKEAEMSRATKGGRDIFYEQFKAHLRAIKEKKRQESTTSYRQSLGKLLATYEKHYSQF
jgi:hypothetical protein